MATASPVKETLDDLLREPGKAELIGGRIVRYMPVGYRPNRVAARIYRSLDDHCEREGRGVATTDNMGYAVPELTSGRQSFSPDAAYYDGPLPANLMRFIEGPPSLAVEVRSEGDYTPSAEREMAAKRLDYFEAGTAVVWDVDPIAETISVYRSANPDAPVVFTRGQVAEAEPAVLGWVVDVDWVFG
jgi:Uma2 family endonuclease